MQNEYLAFARQQHDWLSTEELNDRESGIGITFTVAESQSSASTDQESSVVRVDFIAQLPMELVVHVLAHLDAAQLGIASQVSKLWYQMTRDQHIWRQSFLKEMTNTYATTRPIQPGTGCGIPSIRPGNDWRKIYRARQDLDRRWKIGKQALAVYLNGHLDSIYCLQFDEYASPTPGLRARSEFTANFPIETRSLLDLEIKLFGFGT